MAAPALAEQYANIKVTPKVRMAAMLYATGAVRTKREAAEIAGVTKEYFTHMSNHNNELRRIQNDTTRMIEDESVSTAVILQKLSRRAVGKLAELMDTGSEAIAFRAAQDLADRGQETAKTQKFQVDSLTLNGEDAKELARALVESANLAGKFSEVATHGLVEVDTDKHEQSAALQLMPGQGQGEQSSG